MTHRAGTRPRSLAFRNFLAAVASALDPTHRRERGGAGRQCHRARNRGAAGRSRGCLTYQRTEQYANAQFEPGDRIRLWTPGGGYGAPRERDPALIEEHLCEGYGPQLSRKARRRLS